MMKGESLEGDLGLRVGVVPRTQPAGYRGIRMKKWISVLVLVILAAGCMKNAAFLPGEGENAECFLCGMNEESLMSLYRGRNSLGILCTDRFSVMDVYAGKRMWWEQERENGGDRVRMTIRGELRGSVMIGGDHDRGISEISVALGEDDVLHVDELRGKLCEACMEKFERIQKADGKKTADVFLVDLKTAEIYSLSESRRFYVEDYYVIVEAETEKIDVIVVYVPE